MFSVYPHVDWRDQRLGARFLRFSPSPPRSCRLAMFGAEPLELCGTGTIRVFAIICRPVRRAHTRTHSPEYKHINRHSYRQHSKRLCMCAKYVSRMSSGPWTVVVATPAGYRSAPLGWRQAKRGVGPIQTRYTHKYVYTFEDTNEKDVLVCRWAM